MSEQNLILFIVNEVHVWGYLFQNIHHRRTLHYCGYDAEYLRKIDLREREQKIGYNLSKYMAMAPLSYHR